MLKIRIKIWSNESSRKVNLWNSKLLLDFSKDSRIWIWIFPKKRNLTLTTNSFSFPIISFLFEENKLPGFPKG